MSFLESGERTCQALSHYTSQPVSVATKAIEHRLTRLIRAVSPVHSPSSKGDEQLSTLTRTSLPDETARPTRRSCKRQPFSPYTAPCKSHTINVRVFGLPTELTVLCIDETNKAVPGLLIISWLTKLWIYCTTHRFESHGDV